MMKRREDYTILKTRSDAFAKLVMTAPKFRCLKLLPLLFSGDLPDPPEKIK